VAEQLLQRTVELDEAIAHPDLASDRAMLERVRQEWHAEGLGLIPRARH
jgi:hypothetical protein